MLTERQLRTRRTGLGSSEVPEIVGRSPFVDASPWRVYMAKVDPDGLPPRNNQRALRAGSFLEAGVARMYLDEMGGDIRLHREGKTRRHATEKWMLATPDRYVVVNRKRERGLEVKTVGAGQEDLWGHDEQAVPEHVFIQVQWQMEVTGLDVIDVVAFFMTTREVRIYRITRHPRTISALMTLSRRFWERHVVARVPPPVDPSAACTYGLAATFLQTGYELQPAPDGADKIARSYDAARAAAAAAKSELARCGNELRGMVGPGIGMDAPWGRVTWKNDSRGKVDYKAVADHLLTDVDPAIADRILEQHRRKPARVLRVTVKDDWKEEVA